VNVLDYLRRDLHRAANNGTEVRLKNGGVVVVRATTFRGIERIEAAFPTWVGKLFRHFEDGGGVSPAATDRSVEAFLADIGRALPDWRQPLLLILQDSNPDLPIDDEWMAANLSLPDIRRIFTAWVDENELREFVEKIKKKVTAYAAMLTNRAAARGGSSPQPSP
jgi:hypothetical protein